MSDLLTILVCGSVDDGKSTLMGRLFQSCSGIPADELAELPQIGGQPDIAAWFDGLGDEREQGITIDFATRQLNLEGRRLRVLDAPGHEQYCRNMFTAASLANVALLLVDAGKGPSAQTWRHARLAALAGVRQFAILVTKMDAVGWSKQRFDDIAVRLRETVGDLIGEAPALPVSGLTSANIASRGDAAEWVEGPTLLDWLKNVPQPDPHDLPALRLPVQWVRKDAKGRRWLCGPVLSGDIAPGQKVRIAPSGVEASIAEAAGSADAPMVRLAEDVDCGRGDVLHDPDHGLESADQFEAMLTWFSATPQVPGRRYRLKLGARTVSVRLRKPKYRLDVESGEQLAAKRLERHDLGAAELVALQPLAYTRFGGDDPAARALGSFVLIDPASGETVAAGTVTHPLRRADNIHRQPLIVDTARRAQLMEQKPAILWFTGLSGAGKSTIANLVEEELARRGRHSFLLDGDNLRLGLNKDLGFTDADRIENIRRVGEVARLMADAGLIVLTAFISPFRADRELARKVAGDHLFYEIFVDTPLDVAEARDAKGLYAKARAGDLKNFTGIDSPYQAPDAADLTLDGRASDVATLVEQVLRRLEADGLA
ncbi:adenylyl-sulfate kinase [Sphingomicrobium flavum]|uniref:adenylyl-sulfate kinase n=1 Tax=Sphingomicrobium flavum TaxID=1229164 RepID=UPI0021AD8548|nr:adenylyl-sulfate kinase [Sphingomicrobium flavum]